MTALAALIGLSQQILWLHFLVFLRVGAAVSLFPGFGDRSVPVRIKLALALLITLVITPAVAPGLGNLQSSPATLAWVTLTETGIGLLIGVGIRLFVLALQTAGAIAAQSTSLSQILGTAGIDPIPAMGYLLVLGGMTLVMITGLHVRLAELLILSYGLFPAGGRPEAAAVSVWGIRQVAAAFALGFTLAAPFVIVSVLYNLTLGIINRAMPQMMVVFVGAPVITGAGLVLLLVMAPTMLTIWIDALALFLSAPFGAN